MGVMSGTDDGTAIDADAGAWDDVGARLLGEELAARPGGPMASAGGGRTLPAAVANARERARQQGGGRKPKIERAGSTLTSKNKDENSL